MNETAHDLSRLEREEPLAADGRLLIDGLTEVSCTTMLGGAIYAKRCVCRREVRGPRGRGRAAYFCSNPATCGWTGELHSSPDHALWSGRQTWKRRLAASCPAESSGERQNARQDAALTISIRKGAFAVKILLVLPAAEHLRVTDDSVPKRKMLRFSVLSLTTVAALTPPES